MTNRTTPKLSIDITLTEDTDYDRRVSLDVGRFQRCWVGIGGVGYGSVAIVGTPEQLHALAAQLQACAEEAEAGRALDDATDAVQALTRAGVRGGGAR